MLFIESSLELVKKLDISESSWSVKLRESFK